MEIRDEKFLNLSLISSLKFVRSLLLVAEAGLSVGWWIVPTRRLFFIFEANFVILNFFDDFLFFIKPHAKAESGNYYYGAISQRYQAKNLLEVPIVTNIKPKIYYVT